MTDLVAGLILYVYAFGLICGIHPMMWNVAGVALFAATAIYLQLTDT